MTYPNPRTDRISTANVSWMKQEEEWLVLKQGKFDRTVVADKLQAADLELKANPRIGKGRGSDFLDHLRPRIGILPAGEAHKQTFEVTQVPDNLEASFDDIEGALPGTFVFPDYVLANAGEFPLNGDLSAMWDVVRAFDGSRGLRVQ